MTDRESFSALLDRVRSWGRWGADDQRGAVNLITPDKVLRAVGLVQLGQTISLSRPLPTDPAPNNPLPVQQAMHRTDRPGGGAATDELAMAYHGQATTHLDALCHVWVDGKMWNGKDPDAEIGPDGAAWGGVQHWADGIVTRGVLLDVARHRPHGYVEQDEPVTAEELAAIAARDGVVTEPGDALVIHCGRDAWEAGTGRHWGASTTSIADPRPGLDPTCLEYFSHADPSIVVWDMMDVLPGPYGPGNGTHAALPTQGIGLLDNALLGPLAAACAREGRTDFLVLVAPLVVHGGTGAPVNPLAVL